VTIHGIKGSSSGIAANKIAVLAEALEKAAKDGDLTSVIRGTATFLEKIEALLAALSPLKESADDKARAKERRASPDKELLKELLEACLKYKTAAMETIMEELESFTYDSNGELLEWLRENLENLEYDPMRERLEEFLK
jgi:HPt (histidine-containing phosphotransfer) domain-containing protein